MDHVQKRLGVLVQPAVDFAVKLPENPNFLRRNVEHALSLGLPQLTLSGQAPRSDRLSIIANGPSAARAPMGTLETLRDRPRANILAVNGALKLFRRAPDFWAACDPQELVSDFLIEAPRETTYLVASQCHPEVFRRLRDRRVVLWHLNEEATWDLTRHLEPIAVAPTVTICAFDVSARLGFTRFDTWGWDGCFMDGRGHAAEQREAGSNITNEVGDWVFETTTSWALEARDAVERFRLEPTDLRVHGNGMIAATLDFALPGMGYDAAD